jgi:hypothetical protein
MMRALASGQQRILGVQSSRTRSCKGNLGPLHDLNSRKRDGTAVHCRSAGGDSRATNSQPRTAGTAWRYRRVAATISVKRDAGKG